MTHGLTGPDWALIKEKNKKRLVECLTEKSVEGRCIRLTRYLGFAKDVLIMLQNADARYTGQNPPTMKLANNQNMRVSLIAMMIQNEDIELPGILDRLNMGYADVPLMCERYARLVVGHENDSNCDPIIIELSQAGL